MTTNLTTQTRLALIGDLGDEVGAACNSRSSIIGHERMQVKD
jgi:hypothetical protein